METKEVKNPFDKIYELAEELKQEQQCLVEDAVYGNLDSSAVERSNNRILEIKEELKELEISEQNLLKMAKKTDAEYENEPLTVFKKELPKKGYLLTKIVKCKYCDLISLLTNKVAYIVNIYNDSVVEPICENCYEIQKEKYDLKQTKTNNADKGRNIS